MYRIHIIGSGPRTGTTLLHELMISCFDIDNYNDHESRIYCQEPLKGNIFLTKYPSDYYAVSLPLKLNKKLFVICIIRDPRDAVVSRHGSRPDIYWGGLRYWKLFLKYYKNLKMHKNFVLVKYEDLVNSPDRIQDYIMSKVDILIKKENFTNFHKIAKPHNKSINALKGVRPIKSVGIGNWKNHLQRIAGQLKLHGDVSDDLINFGYEKDKLWLKKLNDINPDFSKGYWPEYFTPIDLAKRKFGSIREVVNILLRMVGINPLRIKLTLKKILGRI